MKNKNLSASGCISLPHLLIACAALLLCQPVIGEEKAATTEPGLPAFGRVFEENCAICHGKHMQGAAQGKPLVGVELSLPDAHCRQQVGTPGVTVRQSGPHP